MLENLLFPNTLLQAGSSTSTACGNSPLIQDAQIFSQLINPTTVPQEQQDAEPCKCGDFLEFFSPSIYDRSHEFLDREGLEIVSPAQSNCKRIISLKPCPKALGLNLNSNRSEPSNITGSPKVAVPSFLLKRQASARAGQNLNSTCSDPNCYKLRIKLFAMTLEETSSSLIEDECAS